MMTEKKLVRQKLNKLIDNLNQLKEIKKYSFEEYNENFYIKRTAERLLQLIVETATDINGHILVKKRQSAPDSYYESFIKLGESEIISKKLAEKLAPSAGLRNRLVHEYDDIKDEMIYNTIPEAIDQYQKYVGEINEYIEKQ